MDLTTSDVLVVIAEVSATFVGFSLAIGLLQASQPGAGLRKQAMHSVAELAMISCGGALVVLVVHTFGLSAKTTWRVGSGLTALFWGATFWWALVRYARAGHSALEDHRVAYAALVSVLGVGLFVVNAAFPTEAVAAIHITGLFLALAGAGYLFWLATFMVEKD